MPLSPALAQLATRIFSYRVQLTLLTELVKEIL